ncbi:hypothetical protein [Mesorhizobium xinjiangense]|uniref:hypothetical protein n=1 Tax=Mesorhizobium xinjiangense TaxID=2678685 RepID=UPI0012EE3555|nr:hypothetical protein [Mesorhizobium xinjiangense]
MVAILCMLLIIIIIIIIEPRTSPVIDALALAAALRFGTCCVLLLMRDAEDMGGTPAPSLFGARSAASLRPAT